LVANDGNACQGRYYQENKMTHRDFPPIHPGEQLREEFMKPLMLSTDLLAKDMDVPTSRIQAIIDEKSCVTGDDASKLGQYFDTTAEFWMNMQRDFDQLDHDAWFRREVEQGLEEAESPDVESASHEDVVARLKAAFRKS
jgi:addiction module HigA family antidote